MFFSSLFTPYNDVMNIVTTYYKFICDLSVSVTDISSNIDKDIIQ
jgi:hypothetical protein